MNATEIKKGVAIIHKNDPHAVVEANFVFPGKGQAFVKTKLKNLKTGNLVEHVFKSNVQVEEADVRYKKVSYLYSDEENFYFMDESSYEQQQVPRDVIGDREKFMQESQIYKGMFLDDFIFDIELPPKMVFEVVEAPPGVKGDSSTNVTKKIKVETGATISVPLFIKKGEKIKVNTDTGEYVERVNE